MFDGPIQPSRGASPIVLSKAVPQTPEQPRYLVVEGPIGVGKTTLAQQLAEALRRPLLLEPVQTNPFLRQFYQSRRANALQTQLFFLLNRARIISDVPHDDLVGPQLVADFLLEKDRLFARLNLNKHEFELYEQLHDAVAPEPPRPDLVIYLQAPAEVLRRRIRRRGIAFEQRIEERYLNAVVNAYTRFFHSYDQAPLLVVNAAEIDFANNQSHLQALLDQVAAMEGSRSYFNPNPTLL